MSESLTVLVVDDHEANRKLFRKLLEIMNFTIVEVTDGLEVHPMTIEHKPALILLDINLPGQSGMEAAKQLRGDARTRDIPIIAITAYADDFSRGNVLGSGCDLYLPKPFKVQEFFAAVAACLGDRADLTLGND